MHPRCSEVYPEKNNNVILSDSEGSRSFAIAQDDIEVPVVFSITGQGWLLIFLI